MPVVITSDVKQMVADQRIAEGNRMRNAHFERLEADAVAKNAGAVPAPKPPDISNLTTAEKMYEGFKQSKPRGSTIVTHVGKLLGGPNTAA